MKKIIKPDWPAPQNIRALTTTKHINVDKNFVAALKLPTEPIWLKQTHSTISVLAEDKNRLIEADASYTDQPNKICAIRTADCLPILITDTHGTQVAAIHAGWKGLLHGVIENTVNQLNSSGYELMAWIGPAISAPHYETTDEIKDLFLSTHPETTTAFTPTHPGHCLANLPKIARIRLNKLGIKQVYGGTHCTYQETDLFYSYRREGKDTGRLISLIWIEATVQPTR